MTTKKKIVTGILLVVIVGLILGSVYLMQRMPEFRDATQEEIAKYADEQREQNRYREI